MAKWSLDKVIDELREDFEKNRIFNYIDQKDTYPFPHPSWPLNDKDNPD